MKSLRAISFNFFVDLFLCTRPLFFLEYTPKKVFAGKKKKLFHIFALIFAMYKKE